MMIKFEGSEQLNSALKKMVAQCPREITRFMRMESELVKRRAKMNTPVDKGRLRNAWSSEVSGATATIFNNVFYSPFVEFGHRVKIHGKFTGKVVAGRHMLRDAVDGAAGSFAADAEKILANIFA